MHADSLDFPSFSIWLEPLTKPEKMPLIQSGAWAVWENKLIILGGRDEGFHGLNQLQDPFKQSRVNQSIWAIDLSSFESLELKLHPKNPEWEQLFSSNMQFEQDGSTLYIVGGFGARHSTDKQSDDTFDTLIAFDLPQLLIEIEQQGDPSNAVVARACSPHLKVTGGELLKIGDLFYLCFGQCFEGVYDPGKSGLYTGAIRVFQLMDQEITLVREIKHESLHRRDLNAVKIYQNEKTFLAGLGGVFDSKGNGYYNPVYYDPNIDECSVTVDPLKQLTNQYNCAKASIFDKESNSCITVLLGGIGQNQYHVSSNSWENGDSGAKIPFVKSITQMIFSKGKMYQYIQIPPQDPEMPGLLGANSIFIPATAFKNHDSIIDYSLLNNQVSTIGLLYGGIEAQRPTSSTIYPTRVNQVIYKVLLEKNEDKSFQTLTKSRLG